MSHKLAGTTEDIIRQRISNQEQPEWCRTLDYIREGYNAQCPQPARPPLWKRVWPITFNTAVAVGRFLVP